MFYNVVTSYDLLVAQPSFDVWSLGCILYQMCSPDVRPLFQGGRDDNLPDDPMIDDSLVSLAEWPAWRKTRKLALIVDPLARNLLSQMLQKDPWHRLTLEEVLTHPFMTGQPAVPRSMNTTLPPSGPSIPLYHKVYKYDVFLSYRVASDGKETPLKHVDKLYRLLTAQGLRVYYKEQASSRPKSSRTFVPLLTRDCTAMAQCRAFVPLLSRDAINHPHIEGQNFSNLSEASRTDNLFLEFRMALELQALGHVERVIPVYIGDFDSATGSYSHYIQTNCHPTPLSDDNNGVRSVESDLLFHLESQAMGAPVEPTRSVNAVMHDITACPGNNLSNTSSDTFNYTLSYRSI